MAVATMRQAAAAALPLRRLLQSTQQQQQQPTLALQQAVRRVETQGFLNGNPSAIPAAAASATMAGPVAAVSLTGGNVCLNGRRPCAEPTSLRRTSFPSAAPDWFRLQPAAAVAGGVASGTFWNAPKAVGSGSRRLLCSVASSVRAAAAAVNEEPIDVEAVVRTEKMLILGGNGFVGSAVSRTAVAQGIDVVSLNRSGRPNIKAPWVDTVEWRAGDVFNVDWSTVLPGVTSVVSCIGAFGSNEFMEKVCGTATVVAVEAAVASPDVSKFVFVSVHNYNLPSFAKDNGYFNGKRRAERAVLDRFPTGGVILRPGFIYGRRRVGNYELPLNLVGAPLESALAATANLSLTKALSRLPASDLLLAPPISVDDVAAAAVEGVLDRDVVGIMDIGKMKELATALKARR